MPKARVSLYQHPDKSVVLDTSATDGAIVGVNLTLSDGTVLTAADILNSNVQPQVIDRDGSPVASGTFGSASSSAIVVFNAAGQIISATDIPIAIAAAAVSGLAASAITDTTNASNITSGTLNRARVAALNSGLTITGSRATDAWRTSLLAALVTALGITDTSTP